MEFSWSSPLSSALPVESWIKSRTLHVLLISIHISILDLSKQCHRYCVSRVAAGYDVFLKTRCFWKKGSAGTFTGDISIGRRFKPGPRHLFYKLDQPGILLLSLPKECARWNRSYLPLRSVSVEGQTSRAHIEYFVITSLLLTFYFCWPNNIFRPLLLQRPKVRLY